MAQGKLKAKASGVAKKAKTQKKSLGPKKGKRAIARKKGGSTKVTTVKKKLAVQINAYAQESVLKKAAALESKPMKLLKAPTVSSEKKVGKASVKKSGKKRK